ncbi:saccharopine dehydrogenase family protein [Amycolatopsis sp. EV170708-02-1]|uniref:saccharopine dehydrogenase family protein n=1 Tax=Amycolatopsis sp. EV170708-02-1 TaxID=2919322 RepID=UPI001F0BE318|nr:saccharopine dehydrogenase NADP-binding domain-containing protein [Amycolatopsis sp. EV170708-02-1]UMP00987.1 saccharopine dehydrogenase NADP-binding domain-containing protein [Amycolatopsis sp. EV170708-02-1]
MRVLALGGGGEMGAAAAAVLAADDSVTEVVIADRDLSRATTVASGLGAKVSARQVDATDHPGLVAAMKPHDLVVNTVGPFFRFGVPILTAAIEAGRDYVDICDDPAPTLRMLELDERAEAAGICALIGTGASPGVASMLAVRAARELDTVETLLTGWNIAAAQPETPRSGTGPSAAIVHMMEQISGTIPVLREGRLVHRPALEKLDWRHPGLGPLSGRTVGHPEAVTLHRAFPTLRSSTNVCVGDKAALRMLAGLRRLIDAGVLSPGRAARLVERAEKLLTSETSDIFKRGTPPPLFAVATGVREGRPAVAATILANTPGFTMAAATGVPLAVSALLVPAARRPGVHTQETLIDADDFFAALAPHCIGDPSPEHMTATTTSWASEEENKRALDASLLTALMR